MRIYRKRVVSSLLAVVVLWFVSLDLVWVLVAKLCELLQFVLLHTGTTPCCQGARTMLMPLEKLMWPGLAASSAETEVIVLRKWGLCFTELCHSGARCALLGRNPVSGIYTGDHGSSFLIYHDLIRREMQPQHAKSFFRTGFMRNTDVWEEGGSPALYKPPGRMSMSWG